jgi:hypothetical protein
MLNNTEHKSQNGTACTESVNAPRNTATKANERRMRRDFRQRRNAISASSGWRVTLW